MSNVEAKLRIKGKVFGIMVDSDKALAFKEGKTAVVMFLVGQVRRKIKETGNQWRPTEESIA